MGEGDTTLRDEEIRAESSWQTRSEVADVDGDDQDTSDDADTDDTDSDSDDVDP